MICQDEFPICQDEFLQNFNFSRQVKIYYDELLLEHIKPADQWNRASKQFIKTDFDQFIM